LTILYPMASLGYIWTLLWSRIFFHEPLTRSKFMGVGLILTGLAFLGLGNR
jgi:multidrug transporter EmrE-like cation transporter